MSCSAVVRLGSGNVRAQELAPADETAALASAAVSAATVLRQAQRRAFEQHHRSMVASDVLHALEDVVEASWPR